MAQQIDLDVDVKGHHEGEDEGEDEGKAGANPRPSASTTTDTLTSSQLHALFDILTHSEVYAEVQKFKDPGIIAAYGFPFSGGLGPDGAPLYATESSAPLLAGLLRGIGIMGKFSEAHLSESYDKGVLGIRKTLATAASAVHEAVSRGILGGIPPKPTEGGLNAISYDRTKAPDLARAWEDAAHNLVYGDLVDELFDCAVEKQSLEEHSPGVQATADYIIIHLAAFMHHVFVLSPEGSYLLKLAENVHNLIPYTIIKSTLRVGNAATMLNGILRLLLAKMSVGAISNWFGLTQNANDGMNLMQRIISIVLSWDGSEYRKSADEIEKAAGGPSKEHLDAIKQFISKPRKDYDRIRKISRTSPTSIVAAILQDHDPKLPASLSESQHTQCVQYLAALLEVRDREEITDVLCNSNPDLFTQAVRDVVASFEPWIRTIHERVDLREHLSAGESFLNDFITTSKPKKPADAVSNDKTNGSSDAKMETAAPSVEDYISLLRRNRHLLYNWIHQLAVKCPEIREVSLSWLKDTMKIFIQKSSPTSASSPRSEDATATTTASSTASQGTKNRKGAAGALSSNLQSLFAALPSETKRDVVSAVDAHAAYLSTLEDVSLKRMQTVLDNLPQDSSTTAAGDPHSGRSMRGPGMFLARWQHLLDECPITPEVPNGPMRRGKDVKSILARGGANGTAADGFDPGALAIVAERDAPDPPKVDVVVEALGPAFYGLVVDLLKNSA
ncbi:hypothetical protein B0T17DRAFT_644607 [Bombardia bombarda]|uniref:Uncharacterized protein n=1 Tax=Bombardia bombarda TaxID=252184 RepID=A0AA39WHP4_9PEZI|nr:hypothetical protein B0T17DRAFT_644607 [Bombardia bombarda]